MKRLLIPVRWYAGEVCCLCILCMLNVRFKFASLYGYISQKV